MQLDKITDALNVEISAQARDAYNWIRGEVKAYGIAYRFCIKQFDEPGVFGIDGGRISKLSLDDYRGWNKPRLQFDRGWDKRPAKKDTALNAAFAALLKMFN